jgi:hypothetical protein
MNDTQKACICIEPHLLKNDRVSQTSVASPEQTVKLQQRTRGHKNDIFHVCVVVQSQLARFFVLSCSIALMALNK